MGFIEYLMGLTKPWVQGPWGRKFADGLGLRGIYMAHNKRYIEKKTSKVRPRELKRLQKLLKRLVLTNAIRLFEIIGLLFV